MQKTHEMHGRASVWDSLTHLLGATAASKKEPTREALLS